MEKLEAKIKKSAPEVSDDWDLAVRNYSAGYQDSAEKTPEPASEQVEDKSKIPWTPKGIWGHKDPVTMTLEEKQQMLKKAKYSGPLATAYWENEIANHQEKSDREEADKNKKRVKELEEETRKLNAEIVELTNDAEKTGQPVQEDVEMNKQLARDVREELEEKKKGLGERFKDGVKSFFDRFRKKSKEESPQENPQKEQKVNQEEEQKKIEELKEKIRRLREERYRKSREVGVIEQTKIEEKYRDKIKVLEDQIKELERGEREKVTGKNVKGWFAERAKGFIGGFGWWEAHQAEKFRLGTKEAGQDLNAQARLLDQEEGLLGPEEAWEEAHEIESQREQEETDLIENLEIDPKEARKLVVEFLSDQISDRKKKENQRLEDKMVAMALAKLEEKLKSRSWVQEYMAAHGGQVITPEKMQELEKKIREEIKKIRQGQVKKDFVNFIKLSRGSLDKKWWARYIYAGLDAVLAGLMIKWIAGKYFGAGVEKIITGAPSGSSLPMETGLKDTIWGEAERMLVEQGVPNPTEAMTQEVASKIAQESGAEVVSQTGEVIWKETAGGAVKDIAMSEGFPLKLKGAYTVISTIKAGLGLP